tara:strand:+ start:7496 stop:9421 length:1926 start_codon:yes stop_codon:yes gene_type:complete
MRSSSKIESMPSRAGSFLLDVHEVEIEMSEFVYNEYSEDEGLAIKKPEFIINSVEASNEKSYARVKFIPPERNTDTPDQMISTVRSLAGMGSSGINVDPGVDPLLTERHIMSERDFGGNLFTGITLKIPNETDEISDLVKEGVSVLVNPTADTDFQSYSTTDFLQDYAATIKENGFLFNEGKDSLANFFASISNQNLGRNNADTISSILSFESQAFYFSAVLDDIVNNTINNSSSIFAESLQEKYSIIEEITNNAQIELKTISNPMSNYYPTIESNKIFDSENLIDLLLNRENRQTFLRDQIYNSTNNRNIAHVGYLFSANIQLPNGDVKILEPKLVVNIEIEEVFLKNITYNSSVSIRIAPVYALNIPVYNINSAGNLILQPSTVFVSGEGRSTVLNAIDTTPPPPPQDLVFNLTSSGLEINWSLPYNIQKDISKFRIFKRKSRNEPFTLVKQIDFGGFDDPNVPEFLNERLRKGEIKSFFTDRTFEQESDFIYAVTCVDVHDLTSNYSEQIRVKINPVFNKLETSLFARIGAYIPYPNMTIEEEIFSNVIKSSGYSKAKVYFNPDFLRVFKTISSNSPEETLLNINSTDDNLFKLNLINIDLQEQQNLDIIIGEKTFISDFESADSAIIKSFIDEDTSL